MVNDNFDNAGEKLNFEKVVSDDDNRRFIKYCKAGVVKLSCFGQTIYLDIEFNDGSRRSCTIENNKNMNEMICRRVHQMINSKTSDLITDLKNLDESKKQFTDY